MGEDEKVYFLTEVSENDLLNTTTDNSETLPKNSAALDLQSLPKTAHYQTIMLIPQEIKHREQKVLRTAPKIARKIQVSRKRIPQKADGSGFTYILIGIAAVAVIGVVYVVKSKKKKENFIDEDEDEDEA